MLLIYSKNYDLLLAECFKYPLKCFWYTLQHWGDYRNQNAHLEKGKAKTKMGKKVMQPLSVLMGWNGISAEAECVKETLVMGKDICCLKHSRACSLRALLAANHLTVMDALTHFQLKRSSASLIILNSGEQIKPSSNQGCARL